MFDASYDTFVIVLADAEKSTVPTLANYFLRSLFETYEVKHSCLRWAILIRGAGKWEGGLRTAAFVSGGMIPKELRGTTNGVTMHIVDWYICPASRGNILLQL